MVPPLVRMYIRSSWTKNSANKPWFAMILHKKSFILYLASKDIVVLNLLCLLYRLSSCGIHQPSFRMFRSLCKRTEIDCRVAPNCNASSSWVERDFDSTIAQKLFLVSKFFRRSGMFFIGKTEITTPKLLIPLFTDFMRYSTFLQSWANHICNLDSIFSIGK